MTTEPMQVSAPTALPPLTGEVRLEADGAVRIITLNRPEKLNAADVNLQRGLVVVWEQIAADPGAAAVVLTGAGRAFSSGGDMSVLAAVGADEPGTRAEMKGISAAMMRAFLTSPLPIVAAVNGLAIGFGAGLAALCDLVVMAEDAYLTDPHARYGMPAAPPCALVWPELTSRAVAKELLLLGTRIEAVDALRLGLANRVVPAGTALDAARALAGELASLPPSGMAAVKRALNAPVLAALESGLVAEDSGTAMDTERSQQAVAGLLASMRH